MFTLADIKKTKEELKFEPEYEIRAGVKKIIKDISEQK